MALELIEELHHNGLSMDSVIYGTLLAICASHNKWEEAESYFNQMKDEGHSPNEFHYSSLLNAYSTAGDYKKADDLVQDMKSAGLVPNKVCFHVHHNQVSVIFKFYYTYLVLLMIERT